MIALPDGFALRPLGAAVGLVFATLALLGFLIHHRVTWYRVLPAAVLAMVLFLVAVFALQGPLQIFFYQSVAEGVSPFWLGGHPWLLPLGLAFLAGLCQEGARLLAILTVRRGWPKPSLPLLGAAQGAAFGGIEAAMVLGAIPTADFHLVSLAVLERIGAVAFHTGCGAALGLGLAQRRTGLVFLLVLLLHLVTDFFAAALSYGIGSLALTEAIALLIGLGLYVTTLVVWQRGPKFLDGSIPA